MIQLQISSYVKQYYALAVETHDHASTNYYTHDSRAKDNKFWDILFLFLDQKQDIFGGRQLVHIVGYSELQLSGSFWVSTFSSVMAKFFGILCKAGLQINSVLQTNCTTSFENVSI